LEKQRLEGPGTPIHNAKLQQKRRRDERYQQAGRTIERQEKEKAQKRANRTRMIHQANERKGMNLTKEEEQLYQEYYRLYPKPQMEAFRKTPEYKKNPGRYQNAKQLNDVEYNRQKKKKRLEKQQLRKQRLKKQQLDQQRWEKQHLEKQRLEKQRLEKQRLDQQRLEKQRLEKQRLEKLQLEQQQWEKQQSKRKQEFWQHVQKDYRQRQEARKRYEKKRDKYKQEEPYFSWKPSSESLQNNDNLFTHQKCKDFFAEHKVTTKKQARKLFLKYHPDKFPHDSDLQKARRKQNLERLTNCMNLIYP
jgi:hypothetical protein